MPAIRLAALAASLTACGLAMVAGTLAAERGGSRPSTTPSDVRDSSAASAARCAALPRAEFATDDVPVQLVASRVVAAAGRVGAHCLLQGYVAPNTGIELRLPLERQVRLGPRLPRSLIRPPHLERRERPETDRDREQPDEHHRSTP